MQRSGLLIIGCLLLLSGSAAAQSAEPAATPPGTEAAPAATAEGAVTTDSAAVEAAPGETAPGDEGGIKDRGVHQRPYGLSGMFYIPWYYGIGIGAVARFEIPIVHDGFISSINDQFSLEPSFSIDYRRRDYGWTVNDDLKFLNIIPAVYAVWSFHITPKFRPYGAIGLGYAVGVWLNDDDYPFADADNNYFFWDTAVGLFYTFTPAIGIRAELGAQGPKFGMSAFF